MRVSKPNPQRMLFKESEIPRRPIKIKSLGAARHHIGMYVEEMIATTLGAERLPTKAGYICPDMRIRLPDRSFCYIESKSSGRNNRIILYEDRCQKYDVFCQENMLLYAVLNHSIPLSILKFNTDLPHLMDIHFRGLHLFPLSHVHRVAYAKEKRVVNKSHKNPRYHEGWTIQLSELLKT